MSEGGLEQDLAARGGKVLPRGVQGGIEMLVGHQLPARLQRTRHVANLVSDPEAVLQGRIDFRQIGPMDLKVQPLGALETVQDAGFGEHRRLLLDGQWLTG